MDDKINLAAKLALLEGPFRLGIVGTLGAPAGVVLVARGSSDNAAIYGRYLLEPAVGRPVSTGSS
jgi:fructoselysine-6-P-deglycase FrlB-like protein